MRTPAGKDCRYYYQDFHRGRNLQECRLIQGNPESLPYRPVDCTNCPIPDILKANASKYLELTLTIKPRLLGIGRRHEVKATCLRHKIEIEDAFVGCPLCNKERPGVDVFRDALNEIEDDEG
jgi:hypothetical protein